MEQQVLDGRYRLDRLLGSGGMAEVWLAEDLRLGRPVAVKLLRESTVHGDDLLPGLEREARLVARFQHPNIAAVYDTGQVEGRQYLVMEYVAGATIRQLLEERGRLSEPEAIRYGTQVGAALQYAHDHGAVHCDVKPENILVTPEGVAKTVDFGVADTVTRTLTPAEAREVLGSIAYLAPEVLQGSPATPRSDVYSLALTVYEMVAGRLPFAGATAAATAGVRLAAAAPPLRTFAASASPLLEVALARALALSPADRFATAAEFGAALRRVAVQPGGAAPVAPRPVSSPVVPPPPVRRRNPTNRIQRPAAAPPARQSNAILVGTIVAAVLLAVAGGVAAALIVSRDRGSSPQPTPTPVATVQPTSTPTPTRTPASTPTPTPSATPSPTRQASPTATRTATPSASPAQTRTPTPTPTASIFPPISLTPTQ